MTLPISYYPLAMYGRLAMGDETARIRQLVIANALLIVNGKLLMETNL